MEIKFTYQNLVLKVVVGAPIVFLLAQVEYYFWGESMSPVIYILISIIIMYALAPRIFKFTYRFFGFVALRKGKICSSSESIELVLNKRKRIFAWNDVTDILYEEYTIYMRRMDKITIKYMKKGTEFDFYIFSQDLVDGERDKTFSEIYEQLKNQLDAKDT